MNIKPVPARWFELLTSRNDLTPALECLANTNAVELETRGESKDLLKLPTLRRYLDDYEESARRYALYWPDPVFTPRGIEREPQALLQRAHARLEDWENAAAPIIRRLQRLSQEKRDARILASLVRQGARELPDMKLLAGAGPILASAMYMLPAGVWPESIPASVITHRIVGKDDTFLIALGPKDDLQVFSGQLETLKARHIQLPDWLPSGSAEALAALEKRLAEIQAEVEQAESRLDEINQAKDLIHVLGDFAWMRWFAKHIPMLPATDRFAWITGWTSDVDGHRLESALEQAQVKFLLRLEEAAPDSESPMLLQNPWWARPFEIFPSLLGTPSAQEADPSRIVAVVAPFLFGYMFGDVGHGFILLVSGLILHTRYPALGILVSGGLLSIFFGFLFGSVFAREDLLPALWLHPLEEPLTVLFVPLVVGAAILILGLGLDAIQEVWQRRGGPWLQSQAGSMVAYLGLLGAPFHQAGLWIFAAGVLWFLIGTVAQNMQHPLQALGQGFVKLLEVLFQLVVNTISFVRVGAFALAHAGLAAAIVGIAEAPQSAWATYFILFVGNIFIIVLEGLVVGIQTTRLVLFEFFIRFLRAGGRQFRPLPGSDISTIENQRRSP